MVHTEGRKGMIVAKMGEKAQNNEIEIGKKWLAREWKLLNYLRIFLRS